MDELSHSRKKRNKEKVTIILSVYKEKRAKFKTSSHYINDPSVKIACHGRFLFWTILRTTITRRRAEIMATTTRLESRLEEADN